MFLFFYTFNFSPVTEPSQFYRNHRLKNGAAFFLTSKSCYVTHKTPVSGNGTVGIKRFSLKNSFSENQVCDLPLDNRADHLAQEKKEMVLRDHDLL